MKLPNLSLFFGLTTLFVLVWTGHAKAATWVVLADGTGDAPTIQSAVSQSASGDVIQVGAGTYYEDILITGKDLTLESLSGYASTVLDGSLEDSSVVVVTDDASHSVTLSGFTIRNGVGTSLNGITYGGGVYGNGYVSLRVQDCRIENNSAVWGGGVYIRRDPTLPYFNIPEVQFLNTVFDENTVTRLGGGLFLEDADSQVLSCTFLNNYTPFDGGGIYLYCQVGNTFISGNHFFDNEALDKGGGIEVNSGGFADGPVLEYNLFVRNKASGADFQDLGTGAGLLLSADTGGIVRNNTFVFNDGAGSSGCSGGAMAITYMNAPVEIRDNLIAYNIGCGIACYSIPDPSQIIMGDNLYWQNSGGDIGHTLDPCNLGWESTIITGDPLFCGADVDNYTCREDSPALVGSSLFGAFLNPGCSAPTAVQVMTWGEIKSRFSHASK